MSKTLTPTQRKWADHAIVQRPPVSSATASWWADPLVQVSHRAFATAARQERERIAQSATARKPWPIDRSELDG